MARKALLVLAFVLVFLFGGTAAYFGAQWLSGEPSAPVVSEDAVVDGVPTPSAPVPTPAQKQNGQAPGWQEVESQNPNGPWARDLAFATSEDGTAFTPAGTFADRAGVPSLARMADGRLVAAFQWFPQDDTAWDKVAVSFSSDDGDTWTDPEPIVVDGLPDGFQRPFDPTVVAADDGTLRLFFTSSDDMPGPDGMTEIYAATSEDGLAYTFERLAFSVEGARVFDSAATIFKTRWHLLAPLHDTGSYHATSDDGVTFVRQSDIGPSTWNTAGNLVAFGDVMRFYGGPKDQVPAMWYSETSDGTSWSEPVSTGLRGGDPAVVARKDGSFLMIYVQ